jgi:outer membrane protein assembly factor BamB
MISPVEPLRRRTCSGWTPRATVLVSILGVASVCGADWSHWRGPFYNGATTETNLPKTWSKTENVAWVTALPGPSAATPIVHGTRVFLPTTDTDTQTLHALALDRGSGRVLWQRKVADGMRKDNLSNYASPSAVTDGKVVVFFYGNGELVAYDLDGKELWHRNLQKDYGQFAYQWTPATSPTLHGGKLFLQVLQRNRPVHGAGRTDGPIDSFVLALDPATGQELWKHVRPSDAVAESFEAYSTPIPFEHAGRQELLIVGGDCLTGHDPERGAELWRWGTWNPTRIGHWRLVPSPVTGGGVVLACGPKGSPVFALKAGGNGVLPDTAIAWKSDLNRVLTSDVPTPLFYLGDFFVLSDVRKSLTRVEPATGRVKWSIDTPGSAKYEASPTGADGKIYLLNFRGDLVVVEAAEGKVLPTIPMGDDGDDRIRSTVAIAHGQLFIRTNAKLYCIGKP